MLELASLKNKKNALQCKVFAQDITTEIPGSIWYKKKARQPA
jgi:hypothetical protein